MGLKARRSALARTFENLCPEGADRNINACATKLVGVHYGLEQQQSMAFMDLTSG